MKKPVRLEKVEIEEEKPLRICKNSLLYGIPLEFILITIIMVSIFILIMIFMGPCTESGLMYNGELA